MEIGEKLRQLRQMRGLTQEEMADRCELTKGFISQVERDLASPSIATLTDMLECLGVSLSDFFSDKGNEKNVFGPHDMFVKEDEERLKGSITWLVPNAQKNDMEPILITLHPGCASQSYAPMDVEEFGYVLQGRIELHCGKQIYTVKKGQTFYFKADRPHFLKNTGTSEAKVLWVSTPPSF